MSFTPISLILLLSVTATMALDRLPAIIAAPALLATSFAVSDANTVSSEETKRTVYEETERRARRKKTTKTKGKKGMGMGMNSPTTKSPTPYPTWSPCFPEGQLVTLPGGTRSTPIEHLQPGDEILGGTITSTLKLKADVGQSLYVFNNTALVEGSHSVFDATGRWTHVEDSELSVETGLYYPVLYNLVTSSHQMVVNGSLFSDWEELSIDTSISSTNELLRLLRTWPLPTLGNTIPETTADYNSKQVNCENGGFLVGSLAPGTLIETPNGVSIAIEALELGDVVNGGVVQGIVHTITSETVTMYLYNESVVADGNAVLFDRFDSTWRRLKDSPLAKSMPSTQTPRVIINLITTSHKFGAAGTIWVDYDAIDEATTNNYASNLQKMNAEL